MSYTDEGLLGFFILRLGVVSSSFFLFGLFTYHITSCLVWRPGLTLFFFSHGPFNGGEWSEPNQSRVIGPRRPALSVPVTHRDQRRHRVRKKKPIKKGVTLRTFGFCLDVQNTVETCWSWGPFHTKVWMCCSLMMVCIQHRRKDHFAHGKSALKGLVHAMTMSVDRLKT